MIISLDKYKNTGGGDAKPTEVLKQTITKNGSQTFNPKEGYVFSSASITTNIHPTETLIATITENGSHSFDGEYNRAQINVDVKQNESDLGYFETPEFIKIKSYINSGNQINNDMYFVSQIGVYNEPVFLLKNRIPLMQYSYNNQSWEYVYDCDGNQLYTNRCPDWYLDSIKNHDSTLFDSVFGNALSNITNTHYGEPLTEDVPYLDSSFNIQYHSNILLPEYSLYNDSISYSYSMNYVDFPTVPNDAYSIDYQNDIIIGKALPSMWIHDSAEWYASNIDDYTKSYLDKTGGYIDYALINIVSNPDNNGRYYFPLTLPESRNDGYYYLNGVNKCCVFYLSGEQKVYDDLKFFLTIDNNFYSVPDLIPINDVKYSLLFDATEYTRSNNMANITSNFFKTGLYEFIVKTSEQSTLIINYGDYAISRLVLEGVQSTAKPIQQIISGFSGKEIVCNYEGNIINCGTSASRLFSGCSNLTSIPKLDISNVTDINSMFYNCSSLTSVPQLDTSNVTNMSNMFVDCFSLTSVPQLDTSNVTDMSSIFGWNTLYNLKDLGGFKNLSISITSYFLDKCPNLTVESLMNVINNLATVSDKSLKFGSTNLNRLTADQIAIATAKGWTLTE